MTQDETGRSPSDLPELRRQVRDLDDQIYALLAARLKLARAIGEAKHAANLPVKDYQVEKDVIERARSQARDLGLYEGMAEETAKLLIKYAVQTQDETRLRRNLQSSLPTRQVLIAGGAGRMGQWLAEFFDSFGHGVHLYDVTPAQSPFEQVTSFEAAAEDHDVIILATPISATLPLIERLTKTMTKALVFDICSLKTPILPAIKQAQTQGLRMTSVHPMFGPGVDTLSGRNIILCQTERPELTAEARSLFSATTANLIELPLERHDRMMAYVLGLSHLTSLIFAEALKTSGEPFRDLKTCASTTFNAQLEVTHSVANENPDLYYEIQVENQFSRELLQELRAAVSSYEDTISRRDRDGFKQLMTASRLYLR